jgi:hypothetical protein
MNRLTSLLWKEWREAQVYLWIGLGLFVGMPIIGGLQFRAWYGHRFELSTSPWVLALGGVLAVLAAVGVTTPDLRPRVADFWQSRPIGVGPWLAAKYGVALAVVLTACAVPLAVERTVAFRADEFDAVYLAFLPFFWTAAFSLGFLAACLIDRPAHAAVLGLAGLLVMYVLPVVVPPLAWLNVADWDDWHRLSGWGRPAAFAGGMLGVSAAAVALSAVGVRRGWRVESGRRLLYGSVATALLLLFASAAFQLGTNLPVLQRVDLPTDEEIQSVQMTGGHGYVLTNTPYRFAEPRKVQTYLRGRLRSLDAGPAGLVIGPAAVVTDTVADHLRSGWASPRKSGFLYQSWSVPAAPTGDVYEVRLGVIDLGPGHAVRSLPLWRADRPGWAELFVWADRLYAFGDRHLVVFDVADPGRPRQLSAGPFTFQDILGKAHVGEVFGGDPTVRCDLIPLPGVPPTGRAAATLAPWGFDGQLLCGRARDDYGTLVGYRLSALDDRSATFERIGQYRPSLLQRLANHEGGVTVGPGTGLVFVMGYSPSDTLSGGVTILDARDPRPMRPAGHFAAPGAWLVQPLPDGQAIVGGGNKLWLVGAPRRAGG